MSISISLHSPTTLLVSKTGIEHANGEKATLGQLDAAALVVALDTQSIKSGVTSNPVLVAPKSGAPNAEMMQCAEEAMQRLLPKNVDTAHLLYALIMRVCLDLAKTARDEGAKDAILARSFTVKQGERDIGAAKDGLKAAITAGVVGLAMQGASVGMAGKAAHNHMKSAKHNKAHALEMRKQVADTDLARNAKRGLDGTVRGGNARGTKRPSEADRVRMEAILKNDPRRHHAADLELRHEVESAKVARLNHGAMTLNASSQVVTPIASEPFQVEAANKRAQSELSRTGAEIESRLANDRSQQAKSYSDEQSRVLANMQEARRREAEVAQSFLRA